MKRTLAQKYEAYRHNMTIGMWKAMSEELKLDVSILERMGAGYVPGDITDEGPRWQNAWVFAERNPKGDVTGLLLRYRDSGKKFCATGSKHGLYYEYDSSSDRSKNRYAPGKHTWMRVDSSDYPFKDKGCPLCGRKTFCRVSADDPTDPPAIECTKIKSKRPTTHGWLHILDTSRNMGGLKASMKISDGPVLCVEGATDWGAGLTLGFDTIGRPFNTGGIKMLQNMSFDGRPIWIIGENDKTVDAAGCANWPGKDGADKTALNLQGFGPILKIFPPEGTKDLHDWLVRGLVRDEFVKYAEEHGDRSEEIDPDVFVDKDIIKIGGRFISENFTVGESPTLRFYYGSWYQWNGSCYEQISLSAVHGRIYDFLDGKQFIATDPSGVKRVQLYLASRAKVSDIVAAFTRGGCLVKNDPPCWTRDVGGPKPENLICFKNGVLDVEEYMDGQVTLLEPSPDFFSTSSCPYDFDDSADSKFVDDFLLETYGGNRDCVDLLWEWCGYLLVPDTSFEKMMLLQGSPRSGKGTVIEMASNIVGTGQHCTTTLRAMTERFGLQPFLGKHMCTLGDVRNPSAGILRRALELMLGLVGGDPQPVEKKGVNDLPLVHLKARFMLAMNEILAVSDETGAMESRLLVLKHFGSHIRDADRKIKKRVIQEAKEGKLVMRALSGLKRLRKNNRFTEPKSSGEIMDQFRSISTPVSTFMQDCCTVESGEVASMDSMFEVWSGWCRINARKSGLPEQFSKWLLGHAPSVKRSASQDGERTMRVFTGIKVQEWAYERYVE